MTGNNLNYRYLKTSAVFGNHLKWSYMSWVNLSLNLNSAPFAQSRISSFYIRSPNTMNVATMLITNV